MDFGRCKAIVEDVIKNTIKLMEDSVPERGKFTSVANCFVIPTTEEGESYCEICIENKMIICA